MLFGKNHYSGFQGVNLRGSGGVLLGFNDPFQGTLTISGGSLDGARAWSLPNKNGIFPISGTFAVQLPAITANAVNSTVVAVTGITSEDGLVVHYVSTYTANGTRGVPVIISAVPSAGSITLQIAEVIGTATVYFEGVVGYTAVR